MNAHQPIQAQAQETKGKWKEHNMWSLISIIAGCFCNLVN